MITDGAGQASLYPLSTAIAQTKAQNAKYRSLFWLLSLSDQWRQVRLDTTQVGKTEAMRMTISLCDSWVIHGRFRLLQHTSFNTVEGHTRDDLPIGAIVRSWLH
jgi:hypothetical protein